MHVKALDRELYAPGRIVGQMELVAVPAIFNPASGLDEAGMGERLLLNFIEHGTVLLILVETEDSGF